MCAISISYYLIYLHALHAYLTSNAHWFLWNKYTVFGKLYAIKYTMKLEEQYYIFGIAMQ